MFIRVPRVSAQPVTRTSAVRKQETVVERTRARAAGEASAYEEEHRPASRLKALRKAAGNPDPGKLPELRREADALREDLGRFTPEAWAKSMDVNLRGPVFLVQEALPHLTASESAAVVNVISAGAFLFSSYTATYAAAKAGMMSFTRSMAAEYAPRGIRVNLVAAGPLRTQAAMGIPGFEEFERGWHERSPLGWSATDIEPVARTCVAVLSDWLPATTGEVIHADGGRHAVGV